MTVIDRMKRMGKRFWIAMGVIAILLIGIRIAMPYVILKVVNKQLANLDGYTGHVEDIDLNLYRGAYVINDLTIKKVEDSVPVPFVDLKELDISVEWRALLNGSFVAEVIMDGLQVNFVSGKGDAAAQTGEKVDWRQQVKDLVPIKINRFEVNNSEIHYRDFSRQPEVDIYMDDLYVLVTNLTNSTDLSEDLASDLTVNANIMSGAPLSINGRIDPYDSLGTFNFDLELEKLPLTDINQFLEAYAKIDAEAGTFSLYAEVAANKGDFEGYVKPLMHDVDILELPEDNENPFKTLWEGIVGITVKIFQNQPNDQFATKVPFSGNLQNPEVNVIGTITSLLRNAFVQALQPHLDGTIGFNDETDTVVDEETSSRKQKREERREERKSS